MKRLALIAVATATLTAIPTGQAAVAAPALAAGAYAIARLDVDVNPKRKTVSGGRRPTFRITVRNRGGRVARNVKLCARVPKPLRPRKECANIGDIAAGAERKARFRVRTAARPELMRFRLRLRATARRTVAGNARAKLIVKPRAAA